MDNDAYENAAGLSPWMRMWSDMAAIAMEASQGWAGPTASPETVRQARSTLIKMWSDSWDEWLRSSAFLDSTRQFLAGAGGAQKQGRDFVDRLQRELRMAGRQDVDELTLAVRRMERRVLDQLEEVSERLDKVSSRLRALESRAEPPEAGSSHHVDTAAPNHRKRKNPRESKTERSAE